MNSDLLKSQEVMDYLRISRATLVRLKASGALKGSKVGGTWRFRQEDVKACIKQGNPAPLQGEEPASC